MSTIVITGSAGRLGRRVTDLVAADPAQHSVLALDIRPTDGGRANVEHRVADLLVDDLKALFHEADVVIHLASVFGPALDDDPGVIRGDEVEIARRVLDAAADNSVGTLVVLSSATVYGAWPNNPIPLTEEAALRPNPGCVFAVQKAEIERLASEWADDHPGTRVVVLRPAVTVAEGKPGWLAAALAAAPAPLGEEEADGQYLDLGDLATAVDRVRQGDVEGAFNVAPDGWLSAESRTALASGTQRVKAPARLANRLATFRWRFRLAPTPPGVVPYRWQPWVVASDRLQATGWSPQWTSDEAFVAGHEAGPWATLSPRRRQELALGASGVAVVGLAIAAVALIRRSRRRARQ